MFTDLVTIKIKSGKGGDGHISFRREKFVRKGGPDGGDGGKGGDIIFECVNNLDTLSFFRQNRKFEAENGGHGEKQKKHGKNGENKIIRVPPGTLVWQIADPDQNEDFEPKKITELTHTDEKTTILTGGRGGFGNWHFKSSVRQVPRVAENGDINQEMRIRLELNLVADVAIIGLPNAGKSTLISKISAAKPVIADYAFTTITPNLGVVDFYQNSAVFCDVPGLIEGAADGKGLGHKFLRHIQRCSVIIHLVSAENEDLKAAYKTIREELKKYDKTLAKKPEIIAISKCELLLDQKIPRGWQKISAATDQNLEKLNKKVFDVIDDERQTRKAKIEEKAEKAEPETKFTIDNDIRTWKIEWIDGIAHVSGNRIEQVARMTDTANWHGLMRIRDILKKIGVTKKLYRQGVSPGDKIYVGDRSIEI